MEWLEILEVYGLMDAPILGICLLLAFTRSSDMEERHLAQTAIKLLVWLVSVPGLFILLSSYFWWDKALIRGLLILCGLGNWVICILVFGLLKPLAENSANKK
jgi:hypothetical protein